MTITDTRKQVLQAIYTHELTRKERLIADLLPPQESIDFVTGGIHATGLDPSLIEARQWWRYRSVNGNDSDAALFGGHGFFGWWNSPVFKYGHTSIKLFGSIAWLLMPILAFFIGAIVYILPNRPDALPPLYLTIIMHILVSCLALLALLALGYFTSGLFTKKLSHLCLRPSTPLNLFHYFLMVNYFCPGGKKFKKQLIASSSNLIPIFNSGGVSTFDSKLNGKHTIQPVIIDIMKSLYSYFNSQHLSTRGLQGFNIDTNDRKIWPNSDHPSISQLDDVCAVLGSQFISALEKKHLGSDNLLVDAPKKMQCL